MDIKLYEDERIDQLYAQDVKIIQSSSVFSFSLDAVLLANFVKPSFKNNKKALDLCAGNGAVGLFISKIFKGKIDEVEIQNRLADMALRSVKLNDLENKITVYNEDLNSIDSILKKDSYDIVTCNPPYFKASSNSKKNPNKYLAIARHEIAVTLEQVISVSSGMLKAGGKLYLVHRPDRLLEILETMKNNRLAPKRIKLVHPKREREANMVLIEAIKDGKIDGMKFLAPIFIYNKDEYTDEVKEMLYGRK